MRVLNGLLLLLVLQACKHPLAIVGEGDIVDINGSSYGCTLEQSLAGAAACTDNEVTGDYFVNYQAVPRPGWRFVRWDGPCGHLSQDDECRFDVASLWVVFWDRDYGDVPIPASTAIFEPFDGQTDYNGSGRFASSGNSIYAGDAAFTAPTNGVLDSIHLGVAETSTPISLPSGLTQVGDAFDLDISEEDLQRLNAPFTISLRYADADVSNENDLLPLLYTGTEFKPVKVISQDTSLNTITFESRSSASVVLSEVTGSIPSSHNTGFIPFLDGFEVSSSGDYYAPGGNAFGMAGYAAWYFANGLTPALGGRFNSNTVEQIATRVQLAQRQSWGRDEWRAEQSLTNSQLGSLIKAYLYFTDEPLVLLMQRDGSAAHAAVVYGYTSTSLLFYDVNLPGLSRNLTFIGSNFGSYSSFSEYGYATLASMGRAEDFASLTAAATAGFPDERDLRVFSPNDGELVSSRSKTLTGLLSGDLSDQNYLYSSVRGFGRLVPVASGSFRHDIEVPTGASTLIHIAGPDVENSSNWFPGSTMEVQSFRGVAPATNLMVTLVWDQDDIDLDLYIEEPGGDSAWHSNTETAGGLSLYTESADGYGPEIATLVDTPEAGIYTVRVHYNSDQGTGRTATGLVNIVINEGDSNQAVKSVPFTITTSGGGSSSPGGTGRAWADIALVDVLGITID